MSALPFLAVVVVILVWAIVLLIGTLASLDETDDGPES